jgi:hypothetical protein
VSEPARPPESCSCTIDGQHDRAFARSEGNVQTYRMRRAEHLEPRTSFSRVCLRCSQEPEPVHRPAKAPSQSVDPPCESVGCLGSFPPSDLARVLACLDGASADSASLGEASRWMARPADFCTPVSGSFRRGSSRAVHAGFCDSPNATAAAMRRSASSCKSSAATRSPSPACRRERRPRALLARRHRRVCRAGPPR